MLAAFSLIGVATVHQVPQGYVGVYYRGGRLLPSISEPGYQFKSPITNVNNVQTTWQTDRLKSVPCGAAKGGTAHLTIEVVNKLSSNKQCVLNMVASHTVNYDKPLIYDNIPHEVAQFCKNYELEDIYISKFDELDEVLMKKLEATIQQFNMSSCLQIQRVRINRPKLERSLQQRFEEVEHEKKKRDLKMEMKRTAAVQGEIEIQNAKLKKQKEKEMAIVNLEIQKLTAQRNSEIQRIKNKEQTIKLKADADAVLYTKQKEAEAVQQGVKALGTVQNYLEAQRIQAYWKSPNKVYYFGDSKGHIPNTFLHPTHSAATPGSAVGAESAPSS